MNFIYTKIMKWLVGEALANSDRVRVAVGAAVTSLLTLIASQCAPCQALLTPEVTHWIVGVVGAAAVALIHSLGTRDVAAPNEIVAGEALPEPPATADGIPQ